MQSKDAKISCTIDMSWYLHESDDLELGYRQNINLKLSSLSNILEKSWKKYKIKLQINFILERTNDF